MTAGLGLGAARPVLRGFLRPGCMRRPLVATHHLYSTTSSSGSISTVPLVYDIHEPEKPVSNNPNQESPILILHALFGSKKNNRSIGKALARHLGRSVYTLDLRNHGESPHDPRHDYPALAEDVGAFVEQYKIDQPTIIGHSMGGKTAMTLALRSPELLKDIVVADIAPVDTVLSRWTDFGKLLRGMKKVEEAQVTTNKQADAIMAEFEETPTIRQFLLGSLYTPEGEKAKKFRIPIDIMTKNLPNMSDFPYRDPSRTRFEGPALFVRGTKSGYMTDEMLPVTGQFFPRFEVAPVESGHMVISENPAAFMEAVLRFLGPKED